MGGNSTTEMGRDHRAHEYSTSTISVLSSVSSSIKNNSSSEVQDPVPLLSKSSEQCIGVDLDRAEHHVLPKTLMILKS